MRLEPHSHVCAECGGLLIVARCAGERVTLDATPAIDGAYRAYLNARGDAWLANAYTPARAWLGTRRRLHVCVVPDLQLELGTEALPSAEPANHQEREAACAKSATSTSPAASRSSSASP